MTNLEKMKQMLEMQQALDKRIIGDKPYPLEKMKIALFVELGEMMNNLPTTFKHWKKSAVDDREKALVELVDCWHFYMSLQLFYNEDVQKINIVATYLVERFEASVDYHIKSLDRLLISICNDCSTSAFVCLVYELGFTFEELYEGYLKKNKINHERQDNNY